MIFSKKWVYQLNNKLETKIKTGKMKKLLVGLMVMMSIGAMAQLKVGFVNSQRLLDTMPSRKAAEVKYLAFEKESYTELQTMQAELEKAIADYQVKAPSLSPVLKESTERKLREKENVFNERQQSMTTELQAYSSELNAPILAKVQEAVKIVSERKKVSYVMDQSSTLYFSPDLDMTAEVAVELLRLDKAQ
jgi:outer membrane protein